MKEIRYSTDIKVATLENCHDGKGEFGFRSLLDGMGSEKFSLMHSDDIPAGVSIGEHAHVKNEEIYYLLSGKGILIFDGREYPMNPGDISLCGNGHSHGFIATEDSVLIVVGSF